MLEGPATGVLLEGIIEELTAHDGLAQDVQRGCGFAVGVVTELVDRFRVGHDGADARFVAAHVIANVPRSTPAGGVVAVKLFFSQVLHKRIQPLVHPRPLALIRIDDHGEEIVSDLVDDHRYHPDFSSLRVRAIRFRTPPIEANHWVLHSDPLGVHRNGNRVRVIDGEFRIRLEGLRDGFR